MPPLPEWVEETDFGKLFADFLSGIFKAGFDPDHMITPEGPKGLGHPFFKAQPAKFLRGSRLVRGVRDTLKERANFGANKFADLQQHLRVRSALTKSGWNASQTTNNWVKVRAGLQVSPWLRGCLEEEGGSAGQNAEPVAPTCASIEHLTAEYPVWVRAVSGSEWSRRTSSGSPGCAVGGESLKGSVASNLTAGSMASQMTFTRTAGSSSGGAISKTVSGSAAEDSGAKPAPSPPPQDDHKIGKLTELKNEVARLAQLAEQKEKEILLLSEGGMGYTK